MKSKVAFFRKKALARTAEGRSPSKEIYLVFDLLGAYLGAGAYTAEEVQNDGSHRFVLM